MKLGFNLKGGLPLSKPGLYLAEIKNNHRVRKRSDGTSCLIIDFEILDSDKKETSSEIGTLRSEWIPLKTFGGLLPSQQALAQLTRITPGLENLTGEEEDAVERIMKATPGRKVVIDCRLQDEYLNLVAIYPPEEWEGMKEKTSEEEVVPRMEEIEKESASEPEETEKDVPEQESEEGSEEIDWEEKIKW
jgi:hypothetical protein